MSVELLVIPFTNIINYSFGVTYWIDRNKLKDKLEKVLPSTAHSIKNITNILFLSLRITLWYSSSVHAFCITKCLIFLFNRGVRIILHFYSIDITIFQCHRANSIHQELGKYIKKCQTSLFLLEFELWVFHSFYLISLIFGRT